VAKVDVRVFAVDDPQESSPIGDDAAGVGAAALKVVEPCLSFVRGGAA